MTGPDLVIDTPAALAAFTEQVQGQSWLTLDTEFFREKTYHARLCLIQIATADQVACIDPLALESTPEPLLALFRDPTIVKVLHSAGQDMEVLWQRYRQLPCPVFDTQIAAALLGHGEQIGYAALVKAELDIELDKSQTRTDWSRRPLSAAQLAYAADDVRHLRTLYQRQRQQLQQTGRLDWHQQDCEVLCDSQRYQPDPDQAWLRIKGRRRFDSRQQAVLQALAGWRERQAIKRDLPRKWVVGDDVLLELARLQPTNRQELAAISGFDARSRGRYGDDLLTVIDQTGTDDSVTTQPTEPYEPDPRQVKALMQQVQQRAAELGVSASILATRSDIERLLAGERSGPVCRGWRAEVIGDALLRRIATAGPD